MNPIYLDHAATTPVSPGALKTMISLMRENYGNPSAVYETGRQARRAVENARRQTAAAIGAKPSEIFFTSGGTESDNWALRGVMHALRHKGKHLITTALEHHAVLNTCAELEKEGFSVTYLCPDANGMIRAGQLAQALTEDTVLVSVMTANNEIGTIEPVADLAETAHHAGALFHTDAVQAVGSIPVDVGSSGVDLLSMSAHKFYGPKGIGALYIRKGTKIEPLLAGGRQEMGLRGGTENVPAIAGMGQALEEATEHLEMNMMKTRTLRDRLETQILAGLDNARMNGCSACRLPGHSSLTFGGIDGEALLLRLDLAGIAASAGSACTAGSLESSHVLRAIGLTETEARGTLRLTVGHDNTREEMDAAAEMVISLVKELRRMSGQLQS